MEFWSYIYSYVTGKFTSLEVSWNQHAKALLTTNTGQLLVRCYPFVELDSTSPYTSYYEDVLVEGKWAYIRCAVNLFTYKYYLNKNSEKTIPTLPAYVKQNPTSLRVVDNMTVANNNYGFSFIREIKLWGSYNFVFYDPSRMYYFLLNLEF